MGWNIKLSCEDAEYYDFKNLKEEDKGKIRYFTKALEALFSEEKINEYLSSRNMGTMTKEFLKEFLTSYVEYLREEAGHIELDSIISMIDNYSEADYELFSAAKKLMNNESGSENEDDDSESKP